ncbi:hypothetical protein CAL26_23810 [Bordetella genomosp. 9]|uniref:Uncharacterized protein n=1 Tax=Bordetella genomosp. 9 TaxID=1416803 RepID=A0A261R680_9BORD|nr:hypothetical protein [Bordetella genomosp. 9]OZI20524.1 hypothetical protein CAL26_23810 [Bordetella genomosp. 9]
MPQKDIQVEPGGIAARKVTNPPVSVNDIALLAQNELLVWVDAGARDLADLHRLLEVIRALTEKVDPTRLWVTVDQIRALARLGSFVAEDAANSMDCCQERFREQIKAWGIQE